MVSCGTNDEPIFHPGGAAHDLDYVTNARLRIAKDYGQKMGDKAWSRYYKVGAFFKRHCGRNYFPTSAAEFSTIQKPSPVTYIIADQTSAANGDMMATVKVTYWVKFKNFRLNSL